MPPWTHGDEIMVSDDFYMPANRKSSEEEKIKFSQDRLAEVRKFLCDEFLSERMVPPVYRAASAEEDWTFYKGDSPRNDWVVHVFYTGEEGSVVTFNRNYWDTRVAAFQEARKCKIAEIDLLYIMMQELQSRGFPVRPADSTLSISLWHR